MLGDPILFFNASVSNYSTQLQLTEMQLSANGCILHLSNSTAIQKRFKVFISI